MKRPITDEFIARLHKEPQKVLVKKFGFKLVAFKIVDASIIAFNAKCPHSGGPLYAGKCENNVIECPWHRYKFDIFSGKEVTKNGSHLTPYNVFKVQMTWFI